MRLTLRTMLAAGLAAMVAAAASPAAAQQASPSTDWSKTLEAARGQTVYLDAWGGSQAINDYLIWAGEAVSERFGIELVHVKLDDTATSVSKILAEKAAGRVDDGSVDLIWINGENFASMLDNGLLGDPFAEALPNWRFVDTSNPAVTTDFALPTQGREAPWGLAKLVFFYDGERTEAATLPASAAELLEWARANPGRFSYPAPPDFAGSGFLKQVLIETVPDRAALARPVDPEIFKEAARGLFEWTDAIRPHLWRQGRVHPENYPAMRQLLADSELDVIFAFNPGEASAGIASGELPETVRSFTFPGGTLGNAHFLAIPFNSGSREAAMVVADFLLSPEAQFRKEDPQYWGDPTVLDVSSLPAADEAAFAAVDRGVATLSADELGPVFAEPHPSWTTLIEAEWQRRYGSGQ